MIRHAIGTAVAAVVLALGMSTQAHAAQVTVPDLTFTALAQGRNSSGQDFLNGSPTLFNASSFNLYVSSNVGDLVMLNTGSGWTTSPYSSVALSFENDGHATSKGFSYGMGTVTVNGTTILGNASSLTLVKDPTGYDAVGTVTVTASGSPWKVGQHIGIDLHLFNLTSISNGETKFIGTDVKGDLAPVPEPATLSLLGMGLLGLAARARRRLAVS